MNVDKLGIEENGLFLVGLYELGSLLYGNHGIRDFVDDRLVDVFGISEDRVSDKLVSVISFIGLCKMGLYSGNSGVFDDDRYVTRMVVEVDQLIENVREFDEASSNELCGTLAIVLYEENRMELVDDSFRVIGVEEEGDYAVYGVSWGAILDLIDFAKERVLPDLRSQYEWVVR